MKRATIFVTAAAAVVALACSSSSSSGASAGTAHCAASAFGCRCESDSFSLLNDESAATTCSAAVAPSGQTWDSLACCYDLDSDGYTTKCDCIPWRCAHNAKDDECICGYYQDDSHGTPVSSCSKNAHDSLCCQQPRVDSDTNACSCNGAYDMCATRPGYEMSTTVTTCGVVPRACIGKAAATCDGLKWKPPAPPSSGGSSSGSTKECSSDSACSGKCGGDCYQCRSGSCSCGYKGTSGSCIF